MLEVSRQLRGATPDERKLHGALAVTARATSSARRTVSRLGSCDRVSSNRCGMPPRRCSGPGDFAPALA